MNSFSKFIDECMNSLYSSSLSIMDFVMISLLASIGENYTMWIWLLIVPWVWYSVKQKIKYDILNGK
jgi:hypothetical protein